MLSTVLGYSLLTEKGDRKGGRVTSHRGEFAEKLKAAEMLANSCPYKSQNVAACGLIRVAVNLGYAVYNL